VVQVSATQLHRGAEIAPARTALCASGA